MDLVTILIFSAIGLITGYFSGLFGIGGGSVRIPLLTLIGISPINAFALNMFSIPFSSGVGTYVHRKNIKWKLIKPFLFGASIGIVISTFFVGFLDNFLLKIIFLFVTIITILLLYLDKLNSNVYNKFNPTNKNLFFGALIGNFVIGLRGGSGGTAFPPLLRAMHLDMHSAIATSLFTGTITSILAVTIYLQRGDIFIIEGIILTITSIIGTFIGSNFSLKTNSEKLRLGLAIVILGLAIIMFFR